MATESRLQQRLLAPGDVVPKYRTRFYSVNQLNGWAAALVGSGAGAPIVGELTTSSITGLRVQADADSFAWLWGLEDDVDVNAPIDIKVVWSSDQTTTADSYTWTLKYTEASEGTGINTAAANALDTAIAADANDATANAIQFTEWGTINGGSLSGTLGDGYMLQLELVATSNGGTVATDLVNWYGFIMRYQPKKV